jgi:hypothetical protein
MVSPHSSNWFLFAGFSNSFPPPSSEPRAPFCFSAVRDTLPVLLRTFNRYFSISYPLIAFVPACGVRSAHSPPPLPPHVCLRLVRISRMFVLDQDFSIFFGNALTSPTHLRSFLYFSRYDLPHIQISTIPRTYLFHDLPHFQISTIPQRLGSASHSDLDCLRLESIDFNERAICSFHQTQYEDSPLNFKSLSTWVYSSSGTYSRSFHPLLPFWHFASHLLVLWAFN